jgi:hypothetical protein
MRQLLHPSSTWPAMEKNQPILSSAGKLLTVSAPHAVSTVDAPPGPGLLQLEDLTARRRKRLPNGQQAYNLGFHQG